MARKHSRDQQLYQAASDGDTPEVLKLLRRGADPNYKQYGLTGLHKACASNHHTTVQVLVKDKRTDINIKSNQLKVTPLHTACSWGHLECVQILTNAGCDTEVVNEKGQTPLEIAEKSGYMDIVNHLTSLKESVTSSSSNIQDDG